MAKAVARGRLLVAAPELGDPTFERTVVLMLDHGDDGDLGVILNRPGRTSVAEPLPEWVGHVAAPSVVFSGGPVAPAAAIGLVRAGARAGTDERAPGWSPLLGNLGTVDLGRSPGDVAVTVEALRVFAGYAGWAPGQLAGEIDGGGWFVVDAWPDDPFSEHPEQLWRRVMARQKGRLAIFANAPSDPSVN